MLMSARLYLAALVLAGGSRVSAAPVAPVSSQSFDPADLDPKAAACDDFYQYACGGWIAKTEIPPDRAGWSRGFYTIDKRNEELLKSVLESFAAAPGEAKDDEQRKLGDYYAACNDEAAAETSSLAALKRRLAAVDAMKDRRALAVQVARAHLEGADVLFSFDNAQDLKNSSEMIGEADQGGLGLPDRDYYLRKVGKNPEILSLYRAHIEAMLVLLGEPRAEAKADAKAVLSIETALAQASMDRTDRRDPQKLYHRLERSGLAKLAPAFAWDAYFEALGYPNIQAVNVTVPGFFTGLNVVLTTRPLPELRAYVRWHLLNRAAPALAKAFVDEDFRFDAKALTGQAELPVRWKRCVSSTEHAMAQPLGRVFVERTFSAASKADTKSMIDGVEAVLGADLQALAWMDDATRKQALEKLARVVNQVGYPDKWRSYAGLKIQRTSYLDNLLAASVFNSRYWLGKIGKPVDRSEWQMPPSAVNAYYSPENNQMVFPAGILQAPFYSDKAAEAVNYGAVGMVMGHELTHGFDDEGRQFDAGGNLRDWWTPAVAKEFDKRSSCLVDQYAKYVAIDGLHVNGKLTLGENIADQGGIKLAYGAWLAKSGGKGVDVAGFNAKQQFFLGFAQSWCSKLRPEFQRMRVTTDPHSPERFRVNGPLANFPEFGAAFGCKEGAPMAPAERCRIW